VEHVLVHGELVGLVLCDLGHDGVGVPGDVADVPQGPDDGRGVPAQPGAVPVEVLCVLAVDLGGAGDGGGPVPPVGVFGDDLHCEVPASASYHDGWVGLLEGFGVADGLTDGVVSSLVGGFVLGPHEPDDVEGLLHLPYPGGGLGVGDAVHCVLVFVVAGAHAEDEPAVGDVVEGGGHLG